jgi:hypothetical protein
MGNQELELTAESRRGEKREGIGEPGVAKGSSLVPALYSLPESLCAACDVGHFEPVIPDTAA